MLRVIFSICLFTVFQICSAQNLTESNLPIIVIDSGIEQINADGRVNANMKVYFNEDGSINKLTDEPTNYDGNVGIKFRGQSSLFIYEKKGYSVETRDELGDDLSVNLLGMPKESDWVLHGPYGDKSLMRNALLYTLADDITPFAPRVQMTEIIVNGNYQGVYLFTEQIKRDDSRVDIAKLKDEDIAGDELTGGYILKIDRADAEDIGWTSPYSESNTQPTNFVHVYPDAGDIQPEQKEYIENWMTAFEDNLASDDYTDPVVGYRKRINTESFIDYMLLNELSRNVDGYRLSTYMYKDKDLNDDELHLGPVWDYNLAFGNADYCNGSDIEGWAYDFNDVCSDDSFQVHFWWKRLLTDPTFEADLKDKWMRLRNGKFTNANINALIDGFEAQLQEPQQRNFQRYPILGQYIWPNNFVGDTYQSEVDYLREWIMERMAWMDAEFDIELSAEESELKDIRLSPNPTSGVIQIIGESIDNNATLEVLNLTGQTLMKTAFSNSIDVSSLERGNYLIHISSNEGVIVKKFVKM